MRVDVAAVSPSLHPRYSPNLHRWLKRQERHGILASRSTVYRDARGQLWIGEVDVEPDLLPSFSGCRLYTVLCEGAKAEVGFYPSVAMAEGMAEVPGFWGEYQRIGRCAIDTDHTTPFIGSETRWATNGDERSCLWCGQWHERLRRWTETVERDRWERVL